MEGVEILNQFTQATPIVGLALFLSAIAASAFSITAVLQFVYDVSLIARIICTFLAVLGFVGIFIFGNAFDHPENLDLQFRETLYQVTISDDVRMSEFLSKYEIVEQEGRIFTVKEK